MLASVENFSHYLYGRAFEVTTDHKALESLQSSKTLSRRLQRMAMKLQQWQITIKYRPGRDSANADALSRQEWKEPQDSSLTGRLSSAEGGVGTTPNGSAPQEEGS